MATCSLMAGGPALGEGGVGLDGDEPADELRVEGRSVGLGGVDDVAGVDRSTVGVDGVAVAGVLDPVDGGAAVEVDVVGP